MNPFTSIIVLNYNGKKYLENCFSSLSKLDYPKEKLEIIMVDNDSNDNSIKFVKENFPWVKIINNEKNFGFSKGNNIGIKASRGELIALLNNDTKVHPRWLRELAKGFSLDDSIGATCPKILFLNKPDVINNAGSMIFEDGRGRDRGYNEVDRGQYDKEEEIFAPCGAAVLFKRKMLNEVGLFDEDFFAYYEDTDLAWRARLRGWKFYYCPKSIVYHVHCGASIEWSPFFTYHVWRNRLLMLLKNANPKLTISQFSRFFIKTCLLGAKIVHKKLRGERIKESAELLKINLQVLKDLAFKLPQFLHKRIVVQKNRTISNREVEKWMVERLKIGIYNPYLATFGGGEKDTSVTAETLSRKYQVELITHSNVDKEELEKRFNVDLTRVNLVIKPEGGIISLPNFLNRLKWIRILKQLSQDYLRIKFTRKYDVFINLVNGPPFPSFAKRNILRVQSPFREKKRKEYSKKPLEYRIKYFIYNIIKSILSPNGFPTYNIILCYSSFAKKWLDHYWGLNSKVLYPPIEPFAAMKKKNYILSVGRFFEGWHCKKHIPMIKAFKQLYDSGIKTWEYHLVGASHKESVHQRYLARVKRECTGYPIYLHIDIPFKELKLLYGKSSIFWHATGLGEEESKHPEKLEHFGITTVEAMSAGCIPVVIAKGGQLEIVTHSENGFLWNTLEELKAFTLKVIKNKNDRKKLSANAVKKSQLFNREIFEKKITEIVENFKEATLINGRVQLLLLL